jgi:hypothetical protein
MRFRQHSQTTAGVVPVGCQPKEVEQMKWTKVAALFVVAVLASSVLVAQTTGRIEGRVTDKDGAPLPGATVTATSPNAQGARVASSESDGRFRLLNLPVGTYLVKAELEGFNVVEASNVVVGLDKTVTLELSMSPVFGEAVTVTAEAPTIDLKTTTGGTTFGQELINDLPTTRTFNGLAFQAPGVIAAGNPDGGAQEPSIGGASAAENRYVVDGLDTTDPAYGTIGSTLAFEFIEEVQVKTGGYEAEYGGALGGTLNVITKSGSNELRGDVFGYFSDDSLQAEPPALTQAGRDLGYTEYDFGADLGGKFIEDKLWYFVAVNPSYNDIDRTTATSNNAITTSIDRLYYAGKLTWQVAPSHQVVFSTFGDPTDRENDALARNSVGLSAHTIETGADSYGLTYNATIGSNMLFEAAAGFYDQTEKQTPLTQEILYIGQGTGATAGAGFVASLLGCPIDNAAFATALVGNRGCVGGTFDQITGDRSRDDYRAALSWFTGTGSVDHEMKFGANYREVEYRDHANTPGGIDGPVTDATGYVYDSNGIAGQRWNVFTPGPFGYTASLSDYDQNSHGFTEETALFAQDQLRIGDYFTLNVGVRAEEFKSTGDKSGLSQFDNGNRQLDFGFGDTVAPRIGFTWDVAKNGKSKLYAHFGRFYESVPLDINVRAFGNENYNFHYFYFYDKTSLPDAANNQGVWYYSYVLGAGTGVDQGMDPMYTEEFVAGFEYEVAPNMSVGLRYVDRSVENVIEDISVDDGHTYFITNPGGCFTVNPVDGHVLDEEVCFPEASREYQAVELTFNKRYSNNWQMGGSYVWSENKGNYGGLFRQENGQLDPNITSLFDLADLLVGADGRLPNDREHQFKLYGSYVWPFKLVTGFTGQYLTGTPFNKFGRHTVYGYERFIVPRGTAGELDDLFQIDVHLEYPISFGEDMELKLIADVFNLTDEDTVTAVDERWTTRRATSTSDPNECGGPGTGPGTACPAGLPSWGTPTAYQAPQTIRLGVKLSF